MNLPLASLISRPAHNGSEHPAIRNNKRCQQHHHCSLSLITPARMIEPIYSLGKYCGCIFHFSLLPPFSSSSSSYLLFPSHFRCFVSSLFFPLFLRLLLRYFLSLTSTIFFSFSRSNFQYFFYLIRFWSEVFSCFWHFCSYFPFFLLFLSCILLTISIFAFRALLLCFFLTLFLV